MVTATAAHLNDATKHHLSQLDTCVAVVTNALTDTKAKEITTMNVAHVTDVTDRVVIANGTSNRHVRALASHVAAEAKKAGFAPIGIEGEEDAEWILVDLVNVVVHIMLPKARRFYDLESLWQQPVEDATYMAVS